MTLFINILYLLTFIAVIYSIPVINKNDTLSHVDTQKKGYNYGTPVVSKNDTLSHVDTQKKGSNYGTPGISKNETLSNVDTQKKENNYQDPNLIIDTNVPLPSKFKFNVTLECQKVINTYADCLKELNENNFDSVCSTYNDANCKKIVKMNIKNHEECKFINQNFGIQELIDNSVIEMNLRCGKAENDEYCPIALYRKTKNDFNVDDSIIYETCKSKSCRKIAINSFKKYKNLSENLNDNFNVNNQKLIKIDLVESSLEILNSQECLELVSSTKPLIIFDIKNIVIILLSFYIYILT